MTPDQQQEPMMEPILSSTTVRITVALFLACSPWRWPCSYGVNSTPPTMAPTGSTGPWRPSTSFP